MENYNNNTPKAKNFCADHLIFIILLIKFHYLYYLYHHHHYLFFTTKETGAERS